MDVTSILAIISISLFFFILFGIIIAIIFASIMGSMGVIWAIADIALTPLLSLYYTLFGKKGCEGIESGMNYSIKQGKEIK